MGLPKIAVDEPLSIEKVLNVIEHPTRYNHIRQLRNLSPSGYYTSALELRLSGSSREEALGNDATIEVDENESIELEVRNIGKDVLYLYVYCLSPRWQVENILYGTHEAIPPRDPAQDDPGVTTQILEFEVSNGVESTRHSNRRLISNIEPERPGIPALPVEVGVCGSPRPAED
ncbi:hypothetical protein F4823DRAFT_559716 [Ustulina deusta]|nr:hypothetical protein F4823DRAFT_559716 [Ustulina deusta]